MAYGDNIGSGTFIPGMGRRIVDVLFDTRNFTTVLPSTKDYFTGRAGSQANGQQLTDGDTNMTANNVPANEKWYLHGLFVQMQAAAAIGVLTLDILDDILLQARSSWLSFSIEKQELFRLPLLSLVGPMASYYQTADGTANVSQVVPGNTLEPGKIDFTAFDPETATTVPNPIVLERNTNFSLTLTGMQALDAERPFRLAFGMPRTKVVAAAS